MSSGTSAVPLTAEIRNPVVAAVFVLRDDGATLMQLRDEKPGLRHSGMWVPPGGHCDPGEEPLDAARRELHEETGYCCGELHWFNRVVDQPSENDRAYQLEVYWTLYDGVQSVACYEGQKVEFLYRHQGDSLPIPRLVLNLWDQVLKINPESAT